MAGTTRTWGLARHLAHALGWIVAAASLAVLVGWMQGSSRLVQVHPAWVPMQFNTALCFLLCAVGLLCRCRELSRAARVVGTMAAALSSTTLLQYMIGVDLGIDEVFWDHQITVETSHAGRMAPNTALGFMLIGTALALPPSRARTRSGISVAVVLAALAVGLALVALAGYVGGSPTGYGWGALTRMALHTTVCFIFVGTGFLLDHVHDDWNKLRSSIKFHATVVAVAGLGAVLFIWQALLGEQARAVDHALAAEARNVAALLRTDVERTEAALRRMSTRYATEREHSEQSWRSDAASYGQDFEGIKALVVIDDASVRWAHPRDTSPPPQPATNQAIRAQLNRGDRASILYAESTGFYVVVTTADATETPHAVVAYLDMVEWLTTVLEPITAAGQAVRIEVDNRPAFANAATPAGPWSSIDLRIGGAAWRVSVAFGAEVLTAVSSPLPGFALAAGLLMCVLATCTMYLKGRADAKAVALAHVTTELRDRESALHDRNTKLSDANARLEEFTSIVSHDLASPVVGTIHLIDWIVEDLGEGVPTDAMKNFERARERLVHLGDMIHELHAYAKITREEFPEEALSPAHMVQEIAESIAPPHGFRIVGPAREMTFTTARVPLETVLRNLVSNAVKHHDRTSGTIEVDVNPDPAGDRVWFSVTDDGPGIPVDQRDRVFRLFQTLHTTTEGTGMGLAFVRRLVEQHGGRVQLTFASEDRGCRFVFDWPVADYRETYQAAAA